MARPRQNAIEAPAVPIGRGVICRQQSRTVINHDGLRRGALDNT